MTLLCLTLWVSVRAVSYKGFVLEMQVKLSMRLMRVVLVGTDHAAFTGGPGAAQWIL